MRRHIALFLDNRITHIARRRTTRHENQTWAARRVILLAVVLVGSACGGSPTNPTPPPTATIPISGTGDAGAVYADLTGFYDLNAVITSSDPVWGPTDGAREVAVLTIEHSPNTSQFVGTFAEFRFIDPDGKSSAGQKGVARGSISLTGQVVIELLHEGRNCHWYGEGMLTSGQIAGRFGDACHIAGTFTADRRRTE